MGKWGKGQTRNQIDITQAQGYIAVSGQGSKGCALRLRQDSLPPTNKYYYSFFWRACMTNKWKDKDGGHKSSVAVEVFVWDISGHFFVCPDAYDSHLRD